MNDGEFHVRYEYLNTNTAATGTRTFTTETYSSTGWHFYYFAFERWGHDSVGYAATDLSDWRNFYWKIGRATDGVGDPVMHEFEELATANRMNMAGTTHYTLGCKKVSADRTVSHMNGWFYWQKGYNNRYMAFKHPDVQKYVLWGELECSSNCHICIPVLEFPLI